ncbi:leukocyte elastase inhibitor-like [Venturia canescens]|uniref:leukocyte elastase inhibitor-like n=1 Tax=Venturia canescens TaxID=32260 RepID=UPI001C9CA2C3|nr:leukocyte elastase inhibitor-like [Venturia canescens]
MYRLSVSLLGMVSLLSVAVVTKSMNSVTNGKTLMEPAERIVALTSVTLSSYMFTDEYITKLSSISLPRFVVSPFGIYLALSLISFGLNGTLKSQMNDALCYAYTFHSVDEMGYDILMDHLTNESAIRTANGFFVTPAIKLKPEFVRTIENAFHLEVHNTDFVKAYESNRKISRWCEDHTSCQMTDRLKIADVDLDKRFSVMNTVSFTGTWLKKFDIEETRFRPFRFNNGTVKQLPTMRISGIFRIKNTDSYSMVELPFKRNVRHSVDISMFIVLPKKTVHFAYFKNIMLDYTFDESAPKEDIDIQLPRFVIGYEILLKESLKTLNLSSLFDPRTKDFSGGENYTGEGVIFSDDMKQTNVLYVNEEGVEVLSAIGCDTVSVREPSQWTARGRRWEPTTGGASSFVVDRSFYVMISTLIKKKSDGQTEEYPTNFLSVLFDG